MSIQDVLGPFGSTFTRIGDTLINKVSNEIFGDGDAARSTTVVIYNHSNNDLFKLSDNFDSGGFSPSSNPNIISAMSAGGYKVESHGVATGVTGADITWGLNTTDAEFVLRVVTSNPFAGDNTQSADTGGGFTKIITGSVGNNNTVEVDIFGSGDGRGA